MKQIKISKAAWVLQMSEPLIQAKKKKNTNRDRNKYAVLECPVV